MSVNSPKPLLSGLLIALAYFATGSLGLLLPAYGTNITLVWLPAGIAVAVLLRGGSRLWPGVFLGAWAVNFAFGAPWLVALGVASGNTLGAWCASRLLQWFPFHTAFDRTRDILYLGASAIAGTAVSASLGVGVLAAAGLAAGDLLRAWLIWWGGDALGVMVGAPLLLTFTRTEWRALLLRRVEFSSWLAAMAGAIALAFVWNGGPTARPLALAAALLPLPLLAWAALRFGALGTSLALILLLVGAAYGTATQRGAFHWGARFEELFLLWLYVAMAATLGWVIFALHVLRVRSVGTQRLFEQALSDVSLGVLFAGIDRRITFVNQGFTRLTGYSESELLGKSCAILQGPETDPSTSGALREALRDFRPFDGEILNYRKDGTSFWNALVISPVRDSSGKVTGFLGIQRDVTPRKTTEMALRRSEDHLRTIVEMEPECVKLVAPDGSLLEMNPAGLSMIEADSIEQVRGRQIADVVIPEDREAFVEVHRRALHGLPGRCEFGVVGLKGTSRWLETHAVPFRNEQREIIAVLGITRDVTLRKTSAAALQEALSRLQKIAGQVPGVVYQFRLYPDGRSCFPFASEAIREIYGVSPEEVSSDASKVFAALYPEDHDGIVASILESARSLTPWRYEYRVKIGDGPVRWLFGNALPQREPDGATLWHGFITDVTERKEAEIEREALNRKLQETQKLESLGVLAGGIAHDFNNILTAILGNASIAEMELPSSSPVQESIRHITSASLRAAELCKQMLAYSGRGRFVVQNLSLCQLVQETAQMLQISISKKVELQFRLARNLPPVEADATQLRQVIMNLVINAAEAIGGDSGIITISTGMEQVAGPEPELSQGNYVTLEVSDTGSGMSEETKARIFEPFFTTKFTGRGLGLAAVLGIVRGHRGALRVASELGRGTTFKLLFPAASGPLDSSSAIPSIPERSLPVGTVLIVDDEETMRKTVGRMLDRIGLRWVAAVDGVGALDILRQHPSRFTLVLLDFTMPHMDGKQTFAELRKLASDLPVILMSGFDAQEAMEGFSGTAPAGFLQKPFTFDALEGLIRKVMP